MSLTSNKPDGQGDRGIEGTLSRHVSSFSSHNKRKLTKTDRAIYEHVEQFLQNLQPIEVPTPLLFFLRRNIPGPSVILKFKCWSVPMKVYIFFIFRHSPCPNAIANLSKIVPRMGLSQWKNEQEA
jgi:hypothetical protein